MRSTIGLVLLAILSVHVAITPAFGYAGPGRLSGSTTSGISAFAQGSPWLLSPDLLFPSSRLPSSTTTYEVRSHAAVPYAGARLSLVLEGRTCTSEPFDLAPGATLTVPVVVPGRQDLPDLVPATATLELSPAGGERLVLTRTTALEVGNGMLVLTLEPETFTRGATGELRFTLQNTGDEPVDLVLATRNGLSPSDALTVLLRDEEDNVLSTTPLRQTTADTLVHAPDGRLAARVAPGATFRSSTFAVPVATGCPDVVSVELAVTPVYWHLGTPEEVALEGPRTTRKVSLVETPYDCAVTSVTPESSRGDVPVVITGTVTDRESGLALPDALVRVVVVVAGFERTFEAYSGPEGTFSLPFQPLVGESGRYQVGATHPARTESPAQAFFTVERLFVSPGRFDVRIPTNYRAPLQVEVTAGRDLSVTGVHLQGVPPAGVHLEPGSPLAALSAGQSAVLTCALWADATAPPTVTFDLVVLSDDGSGTPWATMPVVATFSAAVPSLRATPDHVETGVGLGDQALESLVLENRGLATLRGLTLSVLDHTRTTAATWVQLGCPATPGDLAVGDKQQVSLSFQPPEDLSEGQYTFYLRVQGQNLAPVDLPVFVAVTGSGQGAVLVHVADIYTGTVDRDSLETIVGVAGATVKVQNELVASVSATMGTGTEGTASFAALPVGRYRFRVSAPGHQDYNGSFWIKPGVTQTAEAFLKSDLVTVEWSVVETTIRADDLAPVGPAVTGTGGGECRPILKVLSTKSPFMCANGCDPHRNVGRMNAGIGVRSAQTGAQGLRRVVLYGGIRCCGRRVARERRWGRWVRELSGSPWRVLVRCGRSSSNPVG